ncbi:MAG TPA: hypothetical protein VHX20_20650 [Terracidiphilus sp.]|nr:hypothetical protein [Terracidiphilus sp.]
MQAGFIAAACVLVLFLGCVLLSLRYSVLAQKAVSADDAQNHPANGQGTAGQPTPADLQKAIDAAVDESIKRDEALLDKMLLLVGAYSAILGVLALGTVFISRQEAQAQLKTVKEELAALSSQVRAEFPIISQLQNHLLDLIHKLEAKYPDKVDLNRARPDNWKTTLQQEDGLIDELQIVAVSVVVLDNNSLLKLYLVLAKMYLERFKTGKQNDGDAARGYHYAGRAIQCSANSDEAYRMRGLIGLSRYDLYAEAGKIVAANKDEFAAILSDANADFMRCIQLDRYNAGAYFNLAIIRDHEKNRPEAIALSERIIADRASVSRTEQEKYLPAIYINLACYLADDWEAETGDARKAELLRRILTLCTDGRDYLRATLQSNAALEDFKTNLELVLKNPKDLGKLPEDYKKPLTGLLE